MTLLTLDNIYHAFGDSPLLDGIKFSIDKKERVCLIGRNGAGKSTLFKIIARKIQPDDGTIWTKSNLKIGILQQDLPIKDKLTVFEFVASGLEDIGYWLSEYHILSMNINNDQDMKKLEKIQQKIESADGWRLNQKIETILNKLDLDADQTIDQLSGGWRRRVEMAQALVNNPDILLLDEPTNHLDIIAVSWLEKHLKDFQGSIIFITHDRSFLKHIATRIIELDRGHLISWDCDYSTYLERKEHELEVEAQQNALFDKKLAQEEVWIRQGIKARRTRNEGRVRDLKALRETRSQRRCVQGVSKFLIDNADKSGKLVLEAKGIKHNFGQQCIIDNFDYQLIRQDKVGLIGANGIGKTTFINILLGKIVPDQGSVRLGSQLKIAYFDQLRDQLDLEKTVLDNVSQGRESIEINGKNKHIIGYLGDFLFPAKRCLVPAKALSGGERNRLLLARLFSQPSNLLVLDEPTNDLDVETLELLESLLVSYQGTVLLVSHDRAFLDNVVSSSLVFYPNGHIKEYIGGFDDWIRQGGCIDKLDINKKMDRLEINKGTERNKQALPVKKLSYKDQRELNCIANEIDKLEKKLKLCEEEVRSPNFYNQDSFVIEKTLKKIQELHKKIENKIERWSELEEFQ